MIMQEITSTFVPLRLRECTVSYQEILMRRNYRFFFLHLFVTQANGSEHRPRNVWSFEWIYCPSGRKVLQVKYNN